MLSRLYLDQGELHGNLGSCIRRTAHLGPTEERRLCRMHTMVKSSGSGNLNRPARSCAESSGVRRRSGADGLRPRNAIHPVQEGDGVTSSSEPRPSATSATSTRRCVAQSDFPSSDARSIQAIFSWCSRRPIMKSFVPMSWCLSAQVPASALKVRIMDS
jgi:hypothetical protein